MKKLKVMLSTVFILSMPLIEMAPIVYGATIEPEVELKYNLDSTIFSKTQMKATFAAKEDERLKVYFLTHRNGLSLRRILFNACVSIKIKIRMISRIKRDFKI